MPVKRVILISLIAAVFSWTPPPGSYVVISILIALERLARSAHQPGEGSRANA
jgi:hypothetical protein